MHRGRSLLLVVAFAVSGAAGLAYQVVWSRMLAQSFGATASAVSTVLAVFMGGMGLGAIVAGRRADRLTVASALRAYALVELAIAGLALFAPFVLGASADAYAAIAGAWGFGALARGVARASIAIVALGPPTVLLGTTFPLLARAIAPAPDGTARAIGGLSAANVIGAVAGTLATGFVVLPAIGNAATTRVAAAASVIAAVLALVLSRSEQGSTAPSIDTTPGSPAPLLAITAASGAAILGFEVVWTRTLATLLGASVLAVSAMLACVLAGLAIGSAIAGWIGDRSTRPDRTFAILAALAPIAAIASFRLLPNLYEIAATLPERSGSFWSRELLHPVALAAPLVLPATILSGAALPIGIRAASGGATVARATGAMIGANTIGSIVGALAAGLAGLPELGARGTAMALAAGTGAIVIAAAAVQLGRRSFAPLSLVACALAATVVTTPVIDVRIFAGGLQMLPASLRARIATEGAHARLAISRLLYAAEGADTVVLVEQMRGGRTFSVGGKPEASDSPLDLRNQYLLGHLPAMLHGAPRRSLVVGLGAGTTAGALALHGPLDVCELSTEVVGAARIFADLNHGVADRDGVRIVIEDGRTFLRARRERYDVISVDPIHPYVAGASALYTRDYFALVRSRLTDHGVAAHWLPLYQLGWPEVRGVLGAWLDVFPQGAVYLTGGDAVLIGRADDSPALARASDLAAGYARADVEADLARVYLGSPESLAALGSVGADELAPLVRGAPRPTDDHNWLEFSAPRYATASTPQSLALLIDARREAPSDATDAERRARESYDAILRAIERRWSGAEREELESILAPALERDPEHRELRARREQVDSWW